MSYQVLARKYRPQSFEDIIGQSHVATTLINALKNQKVAHAYLFSGPRGVGKTTTARILAKALNCEKGPTPTPCNACDPCLRIARGQEMVDVLEIDAASNRGIEEIRELRDNVRYAPARSRYKVYIVDEAHQITHDAFNAFLKTLEEPPEHAVFILATTEHQKIPATILSRCQMFRFKRVASEEIATRLEKILKSEKLAVEPAALQRLTRAAGGSVRDALSLLDQALAYVGSDPASKGGLTPAVLTAKQVETLLGFLPDEFLHGFASALLERKPAGVLQWTRQLADEGWELPQFVRDFREYLRQTMVDQLGSDPTSKRGLTPVLQLAGRETHLAEILQMIKVMGVCLDEMRWNDNPQLVLELHALRLTQPFVDAGALMKRIEELERGNPSDPLGGVELSPAQHPIPARRQVDVTPAKTGVDPSSNVSSTTPSRLSNSTGVRDGAHELMDSGLRRNDGSKARAEPSSAPATQSAEPAPDAAVLWKQLLTELWKKPSVASHMERAYLKSATAAEWVVAFADRFAMDATQRSQAFIFDTLERVASRRIIVRFIHEARETRETAPMTVVAVPVAEEKRSAAVQDANVRKVMDVFKGRVRTPDDIEP